MQIITTHTNTDFDALASVIAVSLLYPDAVPVVPGNLNPNVKAFLSIHKDILGTVKAGHIDLEKVNSLIVVDVNRWGRLDRIAPLQHRDDLEILLWDHHMAEGNIDATWSCVEEVGATVTLLVRQLKEQRKLLTPIQATLLLAGIYEDTGNLIFSNTTAEDAFAAGYLLERKADLTVLNTFLKPAYGERQRDILFRMLQTAERTHVNGQRICINHQEIRGHVEGLAVVVNMFREILNVDAVFGIFSDKVKKKCIVIGRSDPEGYDIGEIMRRLGGGGHHGAGSAMLRSADPAVVEEFLIGLVRGEKQATARIADLMSFPVTTVSPRTTLQETAMLLREKGFSGIPVVDKGNLTGVISRRDFRKLKGEHQLKLPVKAFMATGIKTIAPDKSPMDAARKMVKHDIGRLPVVKDGELIGIMTRSDAMVYFYDLLPD